jgi:methionyl-tRNA formyltransferase
LTIVRIVFFGTPQFAVPSLEALIASRHEVVGVVSQPDKPKGRGHQLLPTPIRAAAEAHRIPVLQPLKIREESFLGRIRAFAPDLGVVVAFGRILPDPLIAIPHLGMINVHASILPKYRGAAPIQRAVLAGERQTGVTIMRIATELDAGATFAMKAVPIPSDATSGDMETALARLGTDLLIPVIDDLAAGRAVETPQNHALATFAPKVTKEEGPIDWTKPAEAIHDHIRGMQPWPLASTTIRGTRCVFRKSAVAAGVRGNPATVIRAHGDELIVGCGNDTALRILEIQPEGRRTMSSREFLAGRALSIGERVGS